MSEYYQFRDETGTPIDYYQLVDDNNELCKEIENLQQRISDAIEYIEKNIKFCKNDSQGAYDVCNIRIASDKKLLEILKGGENNR